MIKNKNICYYFVAGSPGSMQEFRGVLKLETYSQAVDSIVQEPRTWLVTGAAGFIGSNLVQRLIELGQNVKVLDNLTSGYARNINEIIENTGIKKASNLDFVEGDIRDINECIRACDRVDHVLHFAAQVSVPVSLEEPVFNNQVNVNGFLNILFAARDRRVRSFVYASSCAVYGDDPKQPKTEEMICEPISPYGLTKLINEQYAALSHRVYGFRTIGLRYFNVFGPRQDPKGAYAAVIPKWISSLLSGQTPVIYGDGEQTRDFCHVENVIQANILAACSQDPEVFGKVFNIASGRSTSINDLYRIVKNRLAEIYPEINGSGPIFNDARFGDIKHSSADIGKAGRLLGYEPTHDLEKGLEESLNWYVNHLS